MADTAPPSSPSPHATLWQLLHTRHSCRAFLPEPLPRDTLQRILSTAQRTASWCNAQPWQVDLVSGAALDRLRTALVAHVASHPAAPDLDWPRDYRGVYQDRRRECGWGLYEALGIPKGDREASARQAALNFTFFGAPHAAIISSDEALGTYGAVDCGAYVTNVLLAAHSLGVGSIAQAAIAAHPAVLREHLGIGDDRHIVCAVALGWADTAHAANRFRTTRADVGDAVRWHG